MISDLAAYPDVLEAASNWLARNDDIAELAISVQQIPAPTGAEAVRANLGRTAVSRSETEGCLSGQYLQCLRSHPWKNFGSGADCQRTHRHRLSCQYGLGHYCR